MLRQIVGMSMLAFLSLACCQTDFRSIFTEASKHLVGILGRQYQNEAVSAAICFQRPDVLEVSGDRIECQDQPEGNNETWRGKSCFTEPQVFAARLEPRSSDHILTGHAYIYSTD